MSQVDDDDWETADFSTLAPSTTKPRPRAAPDLRPTAPAFLPTQSQAVASGSKPRQQRVFAPPGGSGFVVNNSAEQRADWERRAVSASRRGQTQAQEGGGGGEEDEWFRAGQRGQTNRQLWDEANTHSASPTVQIEAPTPLPPPQIKILRRSNQSPSLPGGAGGQKASPSPKTYAEKEEEYRLARERIFGKNAAAPGGSGGTGGNGGSSYDPTSTAGGGGSPSGSRGPSPGPQLSSSPGLVPHQIQRRSPAGSPGGSQSGVLRQPRGPSAGGGFGGGQVPAAGQSFAHQTYPSPGGGPGAGAFPPGW